MCKSLLFVRKFVRVLHDRSLLFSIMVAIKLVSQVSWSPKLRQTKLLQMFDSTFHWRLNEGDNIGQFLSDEITEQ